MKKAKKKALKSPVVPENEKASEPSKSPISIKNKLVRGKLLIAQSPTRLRLLRVEKGLSQGDLAKSLNLSPAAFGDIERGVRPVKIKRAEKIAQTFSHPVNSIFAPSQKYSNKFVAVFVE